MKQNTIPNNTKIHAIMPGLSESPLGGMLAIALIIRYLLFDPNIQPTLWPRSTTAILSSSNRVAVNDLFPGKRQLIDYVFAGKHGIVEM